MSELVNEKLEVIEAYLSNVRSQFDEKTFGKVKYLILNGFSMGLKSADLFRHDHMEYSKFVISVDQMLMDAMKDYRR